MRIHSSWKDYYDYIGYKYGSDPACTYVRAPLKSDSTSSIYIPWPHGGLYTDTILKPTQHISYDLVYVVAGMKIYPAIRRWMPGHEKYTATIFVMDKHGRLLSTEDIKRFSWDYYFPTQERLAELVRTVGAPVFTIKGKSWRGNELEVEAAIPVLKDLGFPSVVPAQQMWQDIYATLQNVLRRNPDKAPPVEVDNKHKIYAAGMDPKTSFRHPVNVKPKKGKKR